MTSNSTDIERLKNAFWEAIIDCLVQFHGFSRTDARARARDRRAGLERVLGNRFEPGIIYHDEPFYIAERLAGHELDLRRHRLEYDAILARRLGSMELDFAEPASTIRPGRDGW